MKKITTILCFLFILFGITGCISTKKNSNIDEVTAIKATLNESGDIIINEDEITETATFISYEVDGVTIGLIAVRGTDGIVRVAFNTCQSCNPSPNAYFIQEGEYLICQNCKSKFHVNKIGEESGGCNPAPVEEITTENNIIIISTDYVSTYKEKFENWNGPKA